MILRPVLAGAAAALVAIAVVRSAAVAAFGSTDPIRAARLWQDHPAVELSTAMAEIARAQRERREVGASALPLIRDAAAKEPLAPEPYLLRGLMSELERDPNAAQQAFEAAQWRDPRSLPAASFLAERFLRTGDVTDGLREISALSRLSPSGGRTVVPYLAAYASKPSNWPALRPFLRAHPELEQGLLNALAANPATVPTALALVDPHEKVQNAPWLATLLDTLAAAGQYAEARTLWEEMSGARGGDLLYDADFRDKISPPPFNWSLAASAVGIAERQPGGHLHVIFYGREDGILASQLLLLKPGTYRLTMQLEGDPLRARMLDWSIWCDGAEAPIGSVTLSNAAARAWSFAVPANCPAQWIKLSAVSGGLAQKIDVTIASLKLERAGPRA